MFGQSRECDHCSNLLLLSLHFFCKNYLKSTYLELNAVISFDGLFSSEVREKLSYFYAVPWSKCKIVHYARCVSIKYLKSTYLELNAVISFDELFSIVKLYTCKMCQKLEVSSLRNFLSKNSGFAKFFPKRCYITMYIHRYICTYIHHVEIMEIYTSLAKISWK